MKSVQRKCEIGCFLAALLVGIELRADTWPVVLVGQPAPGIPGARFRSLGHAAVNAHGELAFHAGLAVGDVEGQGIFKISGGQLSPVVLEGQPAPDDPSSAFGGLGDAQINNAGDVAFLAYLSGRTTRLQGIFVKSRETLRRVVDFDTPVPEAPGQNFTGFGTPQINDSGDIVFNAVLTPGPIQSALFLLSKGSLRLLLPDSGGILNNRGDVVFASNGRINLYANGSVRTVASSGQAVPNSTLVLDKPGYPWINDDGDIVFLDGSELCVRVCNWLSKAIVRWRAGSLEKIAAGGDPVPGIAGATLDSNFLQPQINQSAVLFTGRMFIKGVTNQPDTGPIGLIGRFQNGRLEVVAREDQLVEGIGTLDFIGDPSFDKQRGDLVTFVANTNRGTNIGIYTATTGSYTLLFPQIADGIATGGGWRTTFIVANRSTSPASAIVDFYNDNGTPMNLVIEGQSSSQLPITVPALGVVQFQTDGLGALQSGWAVVQSDQNVSGIALFGFSNESGKFVSEVGAPAGVPLRSISVFVQADPSTSTGVALVNPNRTPADVTLILKDAGSNELARMSLTIPVFGHLAKYVGELFAFQTGTREFEGKLDVVSTQPLVALTLRQRETDFTSLPVIP